MHINTAIGDYFRPHSDPLPKERGYQFAALECSLTRRTVLPLLRERAGERRLLCAKVAKLDGGGIGAPGRFWAFAAALFVCSSVIARAENAVILESFEDDIASASLVSSPGGRPTMTPPGVTLAPYAKQGNEDENV